MRLARRLLGRLAARGRISSPEAEDLLRHTQAIARIGSWRWDLRGRRLLWSEQTYALLGLDPTSSNATPATLLRRVHPDDRGGLEEAWRRCVREGRDRFETELRIVRADDGRTRTLLVRCTFEKDGTGRPLAAHGFVQDVTERVEAERALRRERELTRRLIETPDVVFLQLDSRGRVVDINPAGERITGYTRAELRGRNWLDALVPPDRCPAGAGMRRLAAAGRIPARFASAIWTKTGQQRHMLWRCSPLRDNGTVIGYVAVGMDETARVRAEQRLRESEERSRFLSEATSEGIVLHEDGRIVDVNEAALRMAGRSREELVGSSIFTLAHPRDAEVVLEHLRSGSGEPYEARGVRRDGSTFPCELQPRTLLYRGRPARVVLVRDLTERRRAERELRELNQRLRTLQAIDRAILGAGSAEDVARAALPQLRSLLPCQGARLAVFDFDNGEAWLAATVAGGSDRVAVRAHLPIAEFGVTDDLRQGRVRIVSDLAREPGRSPVEEKLLAEGARSLLVVPLAFRGELLGTLTIAAEAPRALDGGHVDIAREVADQLAIAVQHARLHERTRRHAEELETRVAERTEELRLANRDLAEFAHTASHDLKAPLRAIQGFAEIIARRQSHRLDEEGRRYFEYIAQAAENMDKLLDDLLAYAEVGVARRAWKTVDLADLIAQVLRDMEPRRREAGAEIAVSAGVPPITTVPTLLRQVLANLVDNALKYRRDGIVPRVRIEAAVHGERLALQIADNGPGIAPEHREKVFAIFQRLHGPEHSPGTGIGLAIVRRAVHRLGGGIRLESDPGRGTTFHIELPLGPQS